MPKDPDELLTIDEVAAELKIGYETARQLTVKGRLAFVAVGSGSSRNLRRVRRDTLESFKRAELRSSTQRMIDQANRMVKAQATASSRAASYY